MKYQKLFPEVVKLIEDNKLTEARELYLKTIEGKGIDTLVEPLSVYSIWNLDLDITGNLKKGIALTEQSLEVLKERITNYNSLMKKRQEEVVYEMLKELFSALEQEYNSFDPNSSCAYANIGYNYKGIHIWVQELGYTHFKYNIYIGLKKEVNKDIVKKYKANVVNCPYNDDLFYYQWENKTSENFYQFLNDLEDNITTKRIKYNDSTEIDIYELKFKK